MKIEGGWVYPESMDDVLSLGVILDGDEFETHNLGASHPDDEKDWTPYVNSVGKVMAEKPNGRIDPLASRRPLHLYVPGPPDHAHFI